MDASQRASEFVGLFTQSARRIYAYIRTIVPNQADAEDAFQETSRVLWEKFAEYQPGTDFTAWSLAIAHFKALQALRRKKSDSHLMPSDELAELLVAAAEEVRDTADARYRLLADCVEKLPPTDRELLDSRYQAGATTQAIADARHRSTDSIYRSMRRIHSWLFDCIRRSLAEEAG